jgi:TRAP-type C4-dicarboxylate transport system permease small subunit
VAIPEAAPAASPSAAGLYAAALHRLDRGARWLIIACTGAMVVVVTVQVALRYLLNTSIDWSDEVSRLLFVWCMFLAIPLGIREGAHVAVELLVQHFPDALRRQVARLCTLASIGLMAIVLWQTAIVAGDTWDELMPTLSMSVNWFLVPVGVSAAHSILHLIQLLWREPARPFAAVPE